VSDGGQNWWKVGVENVKEVRESIVKRNGIHKDDKKIYSNGEWHPFE